MANHLEQLISEWFEHRGYFVRRNVWVGKLKHGGWEGELDVVAFNPTSKHLIHLEPSIDAHSWKKREERFTKKFKAGKKYIFREIFTWLKPDTEIEQWAVLWGSDKNVKKVGGGKVIPVWDLYEMISDYIKNEVGHPEGNAISEDFPLLRTMQYTIFWGSKD